MTATDTSNLNGYKLALYIFSVIVKQVLNCEVYPQTRTASKDEYPFVSYNIIVPEVETTGDWLGSVRQFTTAFQFDCHASNFMQASDMATDLWEALHDDGYRRYFKQVNIVPQNINNTSNRTVLTDQNYDQDFGFDCSFLITGTQKYDVDTLNFTYSEDVIESVHAVDNVEGTTFDVDKNKLGGN